MVVESLCISLTFVELRLAMETIDKEQIAKAFEHFLATGNLNSKTNLGLRQVNTLNERKNQMNFLKFRPVAFQSLPNV